MAVNKRLLQGAAAAGELVPSEHFGVVLYEGDGSTSHSINGGKFGAAAYFNGSSSVITLPSALSDGSTTDANCISFWFNVGAEVTSSTAGNEIMNFAQSSSNFGKIALGSTTGNFTGETFSVTSDVTTQYTYSKTNIPASAISINPISRIEKLKQPDTSEAPGICSKQPRSSILHIHTRSMSNAETPELAAVPKVSSSARWEQSTRLGQS